jgi:hypothetical protein
MDLLHRLEFWGDRHHPRWMDIVRIALGIFLVYKAVDFLNNMGDLVSLMSQNTSFGSFAYLLAGHYVVFAHLLGGILLIFGVLTRFACCDTDSCHDRSHFLCWHKQRNAEALFRIAGFNYHTSVTCIFPDRGQWAVVSKTCRKGKEQLKGD